MESLKDHEQLKAEIDVLVQEHQQVMNRAFNLGIDIDVKKSKLRRICPHEVTETRKEDRSRWHYPEYYQVITCTFCGKELEVKKV
jgi:hypothetical protein